MSGETEQKSQQPKPRWKGYATQSQPWRRGYNWARQEGAHAHLPCGEAAEAWGYDYDTPEAAEFGRGADFVMREQFEGIQQQSQERFEAKLKELGPAFTARHPRLS